MGKCVNCGANITDKYTYCKRCYLELEQFDDDYDDYDDLYAEKPLMTQSELKFWHRLKKLLGQKFIVTPQIALSSIIVKNDYGYANELFRTIDFGIFTKRNYKLLALIELNDKSHFTDERIERDQKVKEILKSAGLYNILITFWTHKPDDDDYILQRIEDVIY